MGMGAKKMPAVSLSAFSLEDLLDPLQVFARCTREPRLRTKSAASRHGRLERKAHILHTKRDD